jgi:hypothetical protein
VSIVAIAGEVNRSVLDFRLAPVFEAFAPHCPQNRQDFSWQTLRQSLWDLKLSALAGRNSGYAVLAKSPSLSPRE